MCFFSIYPLELSYSCQWCISLQTTILNSWQILWAGGHGFFLFTFLLLRFKMEWIFILQILTQMIFKYIYNWFFFKIDYNVLGHSPFQLKNDFPGRIQPKLFPGKKLFSLSPDQLEERREMLEKFIQHISQDPVIGVSDQFNDFFVKAQQVYQSFSEYFLVKKYNMWMRYWNKFIIFLSGLLFVDFYYFK